MKFPIKVFVHGKEIFLFKLYVFGARFVFNVTKCHKNNLGSVSHFFKNSGKSPIGLMMLLFNLVNKMRCWTKEI